MRLRVVSEKRPYRELQHTKKTGLTIIVCLLNLLLWLSLFVIGSTLFVTISISNSSETVLVPAIVTVTTALISVMHVLVHSTTNIISDSAQSECKNPARSRTQWLSQATLRLIMLLWLISSGLSITFTLARHPGCLPTTDSSKKSIDVGDQCIVHRSTIGASLPAFFVSLVLFVMNDKVEDPFRAHLFGVAKEPALLPLVLPYKSSQQRPMFSEMSFKCRSSTSLSSHTLVPSFDSTTSLLPGKPEKVVGLGIYAPKASSTFLGPRPSLSSIRAHTTIGTMPPSSPLPPLPPYFPEQYRKGSAMHAAIYPPKRPSRPERSKSERTVRIVPASPALSATNLKLHNNSMESLSSVYSRSISGERHSTRSVPRPATLTDGSRSYSSGSTATLVKSPLGAMRLAEQPEVVVMNKHSRVSSKCSATEIDDVVTLQARLPSLKAVSDFGDVKMWRCESANQKACKDDGRPHKEEFKQRTWMPLQVRRTRNNGSLFQCSSNSSF